MRTIGNVLWLVLCGAWMALGWLFWALVLAITVVGIPFARQCLKLARFSLWPFGRTIVQDPTAPKLGDAKEEVASATAQRFLAAEHFPAARDVIMARCSMCHMAGPVYEGVLQAPKNVHLDSDAAIANHAELVAMQAGFSHAMPPGNATEMTTEERALIVQWFREAGG